ncbi:hypothetical protein BDV59DRAFT_172073 [Aspergillus ambiguus]|uniref:uncharacterized protein n=1 Tax=Aspergillus ambiguus TaxID=176160 RepID=UPI003CCD0C71
MLFADLFPFPVIPMLNNFIVCICIVASGAVRWYETPADFCDATNPNGRLDLVRIITHLGSRRLDGWNEIVRRLVLVLA